MQSNETAQLIDSLREAQIVKPAVLDEFLVNREHLEPRRLATQMVEAQLLTAWQAKFLLSGRNRLRVAGYLLRDRISRNALGDLFVAHHETLGRSVDLLILPASMQQDNQRFQHFLKTSAQLTQLDHPRLAHVYDIGQEGGRYFIVSEQVSSLPASQFSPAEVLTEFQRTVVALDWWQALDYLHRQSSAHGNLDRQALVIDDSQRGKITQLAQALLQSQVLAQDSDLELSEKAQADRQRLAQRVDELLFRENPMRTAVTCQHALKELAAGSVDAWARLGTQLQELVASLRSNETLMNLLPANAAAIEPSHTSASNLVKSAPPAGVSFPAKAPPRSLPSRSTSASSAMSAEAWVRLALTAIGVVVLTGLLVTVWLFRGESAPAESASTTSRRPLEKQPQEKVATNRGQKLSDPFANAARTAGNQAANNTTSSGIEPDPVAKTLTKVNPTDQPKPESTVNSTAKVSKPDPFQVPNNASVSPQPPPVPADLAGTDPTESANNVVHQDLSRLPDFVELQPSEFKERQSLFEWSTTPADNVALKLHVPADVAGKGKLYFNLAESNGVTPAWILEMRAKDESAEPVVVATLLVENGQLWFQWAENTAKNSDANFLINGRLRIARGDQGTFVMLRPTLTLEPLKLTRENFSVKQQTTLQWLPASTRVELADLTLHPQWQKTFVDDITVPEKVGRRIDFKLLEVEQLCWLVLRADIDRRLTLMLDLYSANSRSPIKPQEFAAGIQQVEQTYASLVAAQTLAENQADNAPYGTRTKAREAATDARRQTTAFKKVRELTQEFSALVTEQLDQELPIRVVYENDDYSLILAQSGNFSDKVEPTKPRTRSDR